MLPQVERVLQQDPRTSCMLSPIEEAIGPGRVLVQMVMSEMIRGGKQRKRL